MEDELLQQRREKLSKLRASGVEPYGGKFDKSQSIKDLVEGFQEGGKTSTAGRLVAVRSHGKSAFADLRDATGKIQIHIKEDAVGAEAYALFGLFDIGDIVGVRGECFKTKTGEATVRASEIVLLSKSLRPLPEKWHGLKDIETRYRRRYVDLIVNEEARRVFQFRSRLTSRVRGFLDERGFLEVETPMMQAIPGGAAAKPFVTRHEALDTQLYLRIAPELYLKRLLVGGFDRVYEINRNFRNEGISPRHNPEFTMLEVYAGYWNCQDMMALTEEMIASLAQELLGTTTVKVRDWEISLARPWRREGWHALLQKETGVDLEKASDAEVLAQARKLNVEIQPGQGRWDVLNNIFEKAVEPKLVQPTFVTDYPAPMCPLAKCRKDAPTLTDRFELFVGTQELANAYSELNDPIEQRSRFEEQAKLKAGGLNETRIDEDFLMALEYGMPPAGGLGVGIDRLVMLLTNQDSIRDVILFPQLRPETP